MKRFVSCSLGHLGNDGPETGKVQKSIQDLFDAIDANDEVAVKKILVGRGPSQDLLMTATRCELYKTAEDMAQAKVAKWFRRQKVSTRRQLATSIQRDAREDQGDVESAFTPFHLASRDGQAGVLEQLFDSVIPSNTVKCRLCNQVTNSVDQLTPLHLAVYSPLRTEGKRHEIPVEDFLSGRLCKLARDGNRHKSIDVLLRNGADIEMQGVIQGVHGTKCYGTALHMACLNYCDVTTIELLLQRGANVHATVHAPKDPYLDRCTPLHLVAHVGIHQNEPRALEALKLLLSAGAKATAANASGTALHQIASQGLGEVSFDMARVLVNWSPKVRTNSSVDSDNHWFTPLELLTQRHDCPTPLVRIMCPGDSFATRRALLSLVTSYEKFKAEALNVMLECGVQPNLPVNGGPWLEDSNSRIWSGPGKTGLSFNEESRRFLEELKNRSETKPLHQRCKTTLTEHGRSERLPSGAFQASFQERLEARDEFHESDTQAKHISSDEEDFRITESEPLANTLENGVAKESENPPPVAAPHRDNTRQTNEMVATLTSTTADTNQNQGPQACWVWLLAAMAGHVACDVDLQGLKEIFLAFCSVPGHIPDIPVTLDGLGATCSPMYFALRFLDVPFVLDSFLRRQIKATQCYITTSQGKQLWENPVTVLMEREDISPESEELTSLIAYVLKAGGGKRLDIQSGKTPMHALKSGHERLIPLFLSSGSEVDAKDKEGNTPLISACAKGEAGIARMLIMQNANVLCRNDDNQTPLHVLANAAVEDASLASSLIKAGVNPNARDRSGKKAAEIARARGFLSMADVLEKHISLQKAKAKNPHGKPRRQNSGA